MAQIIVCLLSLYLLIVIFVLNFLNSHTYIVYIYIILCFCLYRDNNLPLLTKEIMEDIPEEKYNVRNYSNQENPLEEQDQEQFYPRPEAIPSKEEFPGHLDFQLLLPNQNAPKHWVVSAFI